MLGDPARALQHGVRFYFESMVLASTGRHDEALTVLRECERVDRPQWMQTFLFSLRALRKVSARPVCRQPNAASRISAIPVCFYMVRNLSYLGASSAPSRTQARHRPGYSAARCSIATHGWPRSQEIRGSASSVSRRSARAEVPVASLVRAANSWLAFLPEIPPLSRRNRSGPDRSNLRIRTADCHQQAVMSESGRQSDDVTDNHGAFGSVVRDPWWWSALHGRGSWTAAFLCGEPRIGLVCGFYVPRCRRLDPRLVGGVAGLWRRSAQRRSSLHRRWDRPAGHVEQGRSDVRRCIPSTSSDVSWGPFGMNPPNCA
jgi:hypothetical protein